MGDIWRMLDRTLVLFIGIVVGAVIGLAFAGGDGDTEARATTPSAAAVAEPVADQPDADACECAERFSPQLTEAIAEGGAIDVGVFGDSFGDGLWAALYRQLPRADNFEVHQFARQSTGFTRYQSLNLLDDIRAKLDAQPVEIAVLSFGANDTQGIWGDGRAAAYMSEEWRRIVGERAAAVITLLRERGAMVYWVGLPKMREADFDADIGAMNDFHAGLMRRLDVPFIDTAALSVDANGRYAPYLPNPETGEPTMARANDGIHMTMTGYGFLTAGLAERIRDYVGEARAEVAERRARTAGSGDGQGSPG